jgi:multiple sugar transport system substrate-binding protein
MNGRMSRFGVSLIATLLVASACSGTSTPAPTQAQPTAPPAPTATPAAAATATPAPVETATAAPVESAEPSATPAPTITVVQPEDAGNATVIRWYCCLGAGDAPVQVDAETQVVNAFNASHTDIKLSLEVVPYDLARDQLSVEIQSGNPPDIVGPVGFGGANAFGDQWLDLTDLIAQNNYDLSQYQNGAVDFYKIGDKQVAIPFAIYPSSLYYLRDAFAEIGLAEPPHKYGEQYTVTGAAGAAAFGVADGTQVPWNYDTLHTLAELLTVDVNGNDATSPDFDPTQIVTYGFEPQRDDMRGLGAYWGAGALAGGPDGMTVQIPAPWATAWKFFYNGIWTDHIMMDYSTYQNTDINPQGYPFCSGKAAMAENFLWSNYCTGGAGDNWDIAAIPENNGTATAAFNADTFRIMKNTKHANEAFQVLAYLLSGDVANTLLQTYGAMPAREEQQQAFFDELSAGLTDANGDPITLQKPIDWQVAIDSVQYADNPNFESPMPAYNESLDLINTYGTRWQSDDGLNMDDQINSLQSELQAIWNK